MSFAPWFEVFSAFTLNSPSDASSQSIGVSAHSSTAQHHCQRPACGHLFFIVWEAEKSKIKLLNLFLHEDSLLDLQAPNSLLTWCRGELRFLFLYNGVYHRDSTLRIPFKQHYLPKDPPPLIIITGYKASTYDLSKDRINCFITEDKINVSKGQIQEVNRLSSIFPFSLTSYTSLKVWWACWRLIRDR